MSTADFSHFDQVLSPIVVFSPDLNLVYANPVAMRLYPWFTSVGLHLFCTKPALLAAREQIRKGHAVILPMENGIKQNFVFQPQFDANGNVVYAFSYMQSAAMSTEDALWVSDAPFWKAVRQELSEPLWELLSLLNSESLGLQDLKCGQAVARIRRRLIRATNFLSKTEDVGLSGSESLRICEAGEVLRLCAKCFVPMSFTCSEPVYLPIGRDSLVRVMTDVLSLLYLQCNRVSVTLERHDRETEIRLVASRRNPVIDSEQTSLWSDLSVIDRRLASVGGRIEIHPRQVGSIRSSLLFPEIRLSLSDVVVGDYSEDLAYSSAISLEFLRDLSDVDLQKEEE